MVHTVNIWTYGIRVIVLIIVGDDAFGRVYSSKHIKALFYALKKISILTFKE